MEKDISFTTEKRKIQELIPSPYNPRTMTEKQNDDLLKSLDKYGLAELPVVNTDGQIIAGHQRLRILSSKNGEDYIVEVRVPNRLLTEEEMKEYNIRSNKNTGSWDWDKLANEFELEKLQEWGFEDWEVGMKGSLDNVDFVDEEMKKELEDNKNITCPFCSKTFQK